MDSPQILIPMNGAEAFDTALRNIRIAIDGTEATFDLILSVTVSEPANAGISPPVPGARLIVESDKCLRVKFSNLRSLQVSEEFVNISDVPETNIESMSTLANGRTPCPFMRVENSIWKKLLPDYQDHENYKHFVMLSMETYVHIIATLESMNWKDNYG